jgi:hypothetical protein
MYTGGFISSNIPRFIFFTDGIYRIVYEEVDESDVKIFCFPSSNSNFGEVEEFR